MQGDEVHSYKYLIKHHSSALNFQNCIIVLYCPHFLLTAIPNSHRRPIGTSHYGYTSVRQRHEYLIRRRWARQAASESTETTCIATKRRHDTGDSTQNASTRPRLNSSQFEFGAGSPAAFESETPLVLFPTSTAYTEATPEGLDEVSGSPDRNRNYSNETPASEASTLMTPSKVCDTNRNSASDHNLLEVIQTSVATTYVAMHSMSGLDKDENVETERELVEDYVFKPKKLFRNLTKVFQASKSNNPTSSLCSN